MRRGDIPAPQAVDISHGTGTGLQIVEGRPDLRKQGAAWAEKLSALSRMARAFTFFRVWASSSAGKGRKTRIFTRPAGIPRARSASTVTLAVPAEEPMSTRAISASSMR